MTRRDDEAPRSVSLEIEVAGTPEQVWDAIATGPGISSWLHRTEVDPDAGTYTFDMGFGRQTGRLTAWQPPRRMVDEVAWKPPGVEPAALASEWSVEARSGGTCVVRLVVSGFGSGAGWDEEVRGFGESMAQALRALRLYLRMFPGRHGHLVTAFGRARGTLDAAFAAFAGALELPDAAAGARIDTPFGLGGTVEEAGRGEWRRDVLVRLDRPAPGFAALSVFAEARRTVIQASLFGDDAAAIAAREQPRWEAWMAEHFPLEPPGR